MGGKFHDAQTIVLGSSGLYFLRKGRRGREDPERGHRVLAGQECGDRRLLLELQLTFLDAGRP